MTFPKEENLGNKRKPMHQVARVIEYSMVTFGCSLFFYPTVDKFYDELLKLVVSSVIE